MCNFIFKEMLLTLGAILLTMSDISTTLILSPASFPVVNIQNIHFFLLVTLVWQGKHG